MIQPSQPSHVSSKKPEAVEEKSEDEAEPAPEESQSSSEKESSRGQNEVEEPQPVSKRSSPAKPPAQLYRTSESDEVMAP